MSRQVTTVSNRVAIIKLKIRMIIVAVKKTAFLLNIVCIISTVNHRYYQTSHKDVYTSIVHSVKLENPFSINLTFQLTFRPLTHTIS